MPEDTLTKYVNNQIYRGGLALKSKLVDAQGRQILPRYFYSRLKQFVSDFENGVPEPRIIALSGLRGVGKTTLLAYLYFDFLKDVSNKFFVSADELTQLVNSNLYDCFEVYQAQTGKRFGQTQDKFYLLIDEVHFDPKWTQTLKSIYDKYPNVFVVCTGSSAIALNTSSDLARRVVIEKVYPLSFAEYIQLKSNYENPENVIFPIEGLQHSLKDILFNSGDILEIESKIQDRRIEGQAADYFAQFDYFELEKYLKYGTMPNNLVFRDEEVALQLNEQLLSRIVDKDLAEFGNFEMSTIAKIKSILLLIASGNSTSVNSLSQSVGLDNATVGEILESLEDCDLIHRVLPFGSAEKKVRKPARYYFSAPVFRYSLLKILEGINTFNRYKGSLLEDVASQTLHRELHVKRLAEIYHDPSAGNADFIIKTLQKKMALEIGFGNKGMEQVQKSVERFGLDFGLVVSEDKPHFWKEEKIARIPLKWFLLV